MWTTTPPDDKSWLACCFYQSHAHVGLKNDKTLRCNAFRFIQPIGCRGLLPWQIRNKRIFTKCTLIIYRRGVCIKQEYKNIFSLKEKHVKKLKNLPRPFLCRDISCIGVRINHKNIKNIFCLMEKHLKKLKKPAATLI